MRVADSAAWLPTTDSFVVCRRSTAAAVGERALEGVQKVSVEQRVDKRVERRVDISDPEQNRDDDWRCFGTEFAAQRIVDVPRKERQPTAEERAHDDAERLGGFILASHLSTLWSLRRLRTVWNTSPLWRGRLGQRRAAIAS